MGNEGKAATIHSKISYKPIEKHGGETPGPGNYESPLLKEKRAPSYGLGSGERQFISKSALDVPASNAYNPGFSQTTKSAAKYGFGSEKRASPIDEK